MTNDDTTLIWRSSGTPDVPVHVLFQFDPDEYDEIKTLVYFEDGSYAIAVFDHPVADGDDFDTDNFICLTGREMEILVNVGAVPPSCVSGSRQPVVGPDDSVLDDPRHQLNESGRTILSDDFPPLQGSVESVEGYRLLPVRVGHNPITGITLEVGPYDFGGDAIATLREAIATVDRIIACTPFRPAR